MPDPGCHRFARDNLSMLLACLSIILDTMQEMVLTSLMQILVYFQDLTIKDVLSDHKARAIGRLGVDKLHC